MASKKGCIKIVVWAHRITRKIGKNNQQGGGVKRGSCKNHLRNADPAPRKGEIVTVLCAKPKGYCRGGGELLEHGILLRYVDTYGNATAAYSLNLAVYRAGGTRWS